MKVFKRLIPIVVVLVIWIVCSPYVNQLFLPKPQKVLESFITLIQNGMLPKSIVTSFMRITIATVMACAVSIPLGMLAVNFKFVDDAITPVTNVLRFIPVTVFYPLLMMWLGIGEEMKIMFLFMATFTYFLPTVMLSFQEVNPNLVDTGYTMGMSRLQVATKVIFPYALPSICSSFLMMYGIGWTYVIIVEVVNAKSGLGHLINISSARGRTDLVFVAVFTITIISYLLDTVGKSLIRKSFKWKFAREIGD